MCEGLGGYLAEIRSEEQQTFLVGLLALREGVKVEKKIKVS